MPFQAEKYYAMGMLPIEKRHTIFRREALSTAKSIMNILEIGDKLKLDVDRQELFQLHFAAYYLTKRNSEPNRKIRGLQAIHPPFFVPIIDPVLQRAENIQTETEKVSRDLQQDAFVKAEHIREKVTLEAKSFLSETTEPAQIIAWENTGVLDDTVNTLYQSLLSEQMRPEEVRNAANLISSVYFQTEGVSPQAWFTQLIETVDSFSPKRE